MNKDLEYYGGNGFGGVRENGSFEVLAASGDKKFKRLSKARKYYDSLDEEKAFWDMTGCPELLDCYVLNPNGKILKKIK